MNINSKRIIILICGAIVFGIAAIIISGCPHDWIDGIWNVWSEPTCQVPKTCVICGATEGRVLPHDWKDSSCKNPTPCSMCGTLEGLEITHEWQADGSKVCVHCGLDLRPSDERFIENLEISLEMRWELMGENPWYGIQTAEEWNAIFDTEIALLEEFSEAHFENADLGKHAKKYIGILLKAKEELGTLAFEEWLQKYYDSFRHEQNSALYEMSLLYEISVSEENAEKYSELIESGKKIVSISELIDGFRYHNLGSYSGNYSYDGIFENTTDYDFTYFICSVEFYDKDGELITTKKFSFYNWEPGEKITRRFTLTGSSSGERVVSIKWE